MTTTCDGERHYTGDCRGPFCDTCPRCPRCGYRVVVHDGEMDCDAQDAALAVLRGASNG